MAHRYFWLASVWTHVEKHKRLVPFVCHTSRSVLLTVQSHLEWGYAGGRRSRCDADEYICQVRGSHRSCDGEVRSTEATASVLACQGQKALHSAGSMVWDGQRRGGLARQRVAPVCVSSSLPAERPSPLTRTLVPPAVGPLHGPIAVTLIGRRSSLRVWRTYFSIQMRLQRSCENRARGKHNTWGTDHMGNRAYGVNATWNTDGVCEAYSRRWQWDGGGGLTAVVLLAGWLCVWLGRV